MIHMISEGGGGGGRRRREEEEKGGGHRGDLGFIIHHTAELHFVFLRRTEKKREVGFVQGGETRPDLLII